MLLLPWHKKITALGYHHTTNGPSPLRAVTSLRSFYRTDLNLDLFHFQTGTLHNLVSHFKYLTRFSKYCAYMHFIQFFSPFFKIKFIQNDSSLQFETIRHDLYKFMSHCVHICFILIVQDSFKMTAVSNSKPSGITYILCSQVLRADCTRFTQTTLA